MGEVRREQPTLRYEAFKSRRSAISTYFSLVPGADRMGEHPLVSAYMRGLAKVAPTDLARHDVQDIDLKSVDQVLRAWAQQEKKGRLSYEKKAARAGFLMYLTGMRGCDQMRVKLSQCKIPSDVMMPVDLKMSWTKESKLLLRGTVWQKIVGVARPLEHWCPVRAIHALTNARPRGKDVADTLLVQPDGKPYSRNAITRIIRILLTEAGMPADTRVHTLRLVGATTALEAAIPEAMVRKAFRFSLTSDTLDRHYNRPAAAVAQAVAEAATRQHRASSQPSAEEEGESRPRGGAKKDASAVRVKIIRAKGKRLPRGRKRIS
jgi:site-specific recombinase XerD